MNIITYLKVTKSKARYGKASLKLFTKKPTCAANEVALELNINLPDTLFDRPQFKVSLVVDPKDVGKPIVTVDMQSDIAKILKDQLGVHVNVSIEGNSDPDRDAKNSIIDQMG